MSELKQFSSDDYVKAILLAVNENLSKAEFKVSEETNVQVDDEMLQAFTKLGVMQQENKLMFKQVIAELDLLNNLEPNVNLPYVLTGSKYHISLNANIATIEKINDNYLITYNGDVLDNKSATLEDALQHVYILSCEYQFFMNTGFTSNTVRIYLAQFSGLFDK